MNHLRPHEARLAELASRRRAQQLRTQLLADDIAATVAEAQTAGMPVTRIARRLGIDRSVLYRVYLRDR